MKANNQPLYVNKRSNHPPNILRNIPESVNKRLSAISTNETVFDQAKQPYEKALHDSGYDYKMKFKQEQNSNSVGSSQKRNRSRNITWFNPPYSSNVKTNIGKKFLDLVDKCFPPNNKLHKIINRNTVKISYSCMSNIKQKISNHNKTILKSADENPKPKCNCRKSDECPLKGECRTAGVIYQARVTRHDNSKQETYIGLTENEFKKRYANHTMSFRNKDKRNSTMLSQYVWKLKDSNIGYTLQWKIIDRGKPYTPESKICRLCLKEKYYILCQPHMSSLNSRSELCSECRHRKKHLLCNS